MSDPKTAKDSRKIPADLDKYLDALLVIDSADDARELIANPDLLEDLEFHEATEVEDDAEAT